MVQGLLTHGLHIALLGYTLAPEASLAGMVKEVPDSIAWLYTYVSDFGGNPAHR